MASLSEALAIAMAHHRAGRLELAEEVYRRILAVEPDHADALHLLGKIADDRGQYALAADYIRQAMAIEPEAAACHNSLGNALLAMGRCEEALASYRRAVELRPGYSEALNNLGAALHGQGKLVEAIACYRTAVEHAPDYLDAINNLGIALQELGRLEESLAWCRRAWQLSPDDVRTQTNLGNALLRLEQWEEAAAVYHGVLTRTPDAAVVHNSLGVALRGQGRLSEAIACHRHALQLAPRDAAACNNLAVALQAQGEVGEAIAWYRKSLESQPENAEAQGNLLLAMEYAPGVGPAQLAEAYAEYDRRQGEPLRRSWPAHGNVRDPERTLRLGFVAADFRHHPVGYSFLRVIESLRGMDCRLTCYANRLYEKDAFTERFEAAAHAWREVRRLSDAELAAQIRADGIDVLFDLCGHFAGSRLLAFARRPAPIQIAWTGPTGLSAMDYLLADRHLVPPGAEACYRERVLRMPDAYTCFEPPPHAPEVGPLPAARLGYVTFGTLNNLAKITPQVIDAWAEILRRVPFARLLLRHLNSAGGGDDCGRVQAAFATAGIDASRVEVVGRAPYAERLDLYQRIDVSLDPFPFSGATTTYESLWMGVPVVALPGATYYRRMCLTHLVHAGLEELVAGDVSDYINRAVALAADLPRLAGLRAGLRARLAASPLYDGPRFAQNLLLLLRTVWRAWCNLPQPLIPNP
jgi:predicted O-linked N-acetylglucosamine transferase (SPINDLY family)